MYISDVDAALASIDELVNKFDNDFSSTVSLINLLERNETTGITMDEGKALVKMGIGIELDDLGPHRSHVSTESAVLTDSGKMGLYGLAIGAVVVLIGFIIKKIHEWFKGDSKGGSGTVSNKEMAKEVPSMDSNPDNTMPLPIFLTSEDDIDDFTSGIQEFLNTAEGLYTKISEVKDDLPDSEYDALTGVVFKSMNAAIVKLGYDPDVTNITKLATFVRDTPLVELGMASLKNYPVQINAVKLNVRKSVIKSIEDSSKKFEALSGKKGTTAKATMIKGVSSVVTAVLSRTFLKTVSVVKDHNTFLDKSSIAYSRVFNRKSIATLKDEDSLKKYLDSIDETEYDQLEKVLDKIISDKVDAGASVSIIERYSRYKTIISDYADSVKKSLEGDKSDKKKD